MNLSDLSNLFMFAGGIGMFLYGMNIMADGMQKSASGKMQKLLGLLTSNRLLAVGVGALITMIIQSSGATTVMVVGFVNAGVLTLSQAVGVIMGANIGTTITAWIVSMGQIGDAATLLQPSFYAPLLIGIGAFIVLFSKKQNKKVAGEIVVGIGLLFMGLDFMSSSVSSYTDAPIFSDAFRFFGSNPLLGMLVGILVTALLQSSSASVGILQTLAANGIVTTNAAIYITLGQNIGSCVTALLSSIGANKTAKRAASIHLMFNVVGALIFGTLGFAVFLINPVLAAHNISSVEISIFHTLFNVTCTVVMFPFANVFVKVSGMIIKDKSEPASLEDSEKDSAEQSLRHLDSRILETPSFAVETGLKEVVNMGNMALDNLKNSIDAVVNNNTEKIELVMEMEKKVDLMEKYLTEYLVKVNNLSLSEKQHLLVNNLFHAIIDIERVSDHAENLAELANYKEEHNITFSEEGKVELFDLCAIVNNCFEAAIAARKTGSMEAVRKVIQLEDMVDTLEEELRDKHIERLSQGLCNTNNGVVFLDILSNLERVSDHANNIAGCVKDEL